MGKSGEMLIDVKDRESDLSEKFGWYVPTESELNKSFEDHAEAIKMRDYYKSKSIRLRCEKYDLKEELNRHYELRVISQHKIRELEMIISQYRCDVEEYLKKIQGLEYTNMVLKDIQGDTIKHVQSEEQLNCGIIDVLEEKIRQLKADNEALTNKLKYVTSQNLLMFVTDKEQKAEIETLTRKNYLLKIANRILKFRQEDAVRKKNQNVDELCSGSIHVLDKSTEYSLKLMFCFFVVFIISFAIIEYFG